VIASSTTRETSARTPTLLVVDDEPHVLTALRRTLRREPYALATASCAAEALARLEDAPVGAVLSDHRMPDRGGLTLLREIRGRWPDIPRLLLCGAPEALDPDAVEAAGLVAVIPKPWEQRELRSCLSRVLLSEGTEAPSPR
jgi:CheY-like chemotaxis protein